MYRVKQIAVSFECPKNIMGHVIFWGYPIDKTIECPKIFNIEYPIKINNGVILLGHSNDTTTNDTLSDSPNRD